MQRYEKKRRMTRKSVENDEGKSGKTDRAAAHFSARSDLQSDLTEYQHFQCALHIFSRIINPDILAAGLQIRPSGGVKKSDSTSQE